MRYPIALLAALLVAAPALAHTGVVKVRTGPEPSDIALFGIAAVAIVLVRRALRNRFAKRRRDLRDPPKD